MSENWDILISEFIINYWIHSSLFVGAALLAFKARLFSADARGEWLLKSALLGGVITSFLLTVDFQLLARDEQLLNYQWTIEQPEMSNAVGKSGINSDVQSSHKNVGTNPSSPVNFQVGQSTAASSSFSQSKQSKTEPAIVNSVETNGASPDQKLGLNNTNSLFGIEQLPLWMSYFWLFSILFIAGIKSYQLYYLRRLLNDRTPIEDPLVLHIFNQLIAQSGINKQVKISQCENINSPIALASNEVVLPLGITQYFQREQIKAALAHELAHLKRKDNFWLAIYQLKACLFFFQPLNKLLTQVLYQFAEQRSDEMAARWTGNPKALAEALSVSAEINLLSSQSQLVLAMKSNKGNLLTRVENLMKKSNVQSKRISLVIGIVLSLFVLLASPGFSINSVSLINKVHAKPFGDSDNTEIVLEDNDVIYMSSTHEDDGKKIKVEAKLRGKLKFNQEETALIDFPQNSELDITIGNDGDENRLRIERGSDEVEYTFYQDGDKRAYDSKAQKWFASVIPYILRTTGIDAEARVARIRHKNGDGAVLDEVELIHSDYVKGLYMHYLFEQSKLSDRDLYRAIKLTTKINSDFEQAKVLKALAKLQNITQQEHWFAVLKATKTIDSDFEQANVLKSFLGLIPDDSDIQQAFFKVSTNISSDFEMRRVFSSFLKKHHTDVNGMIAMFSAAKAIDSDFELASLLIEAKDKLGTSHSVFDAYLELADSISSDFEMRRAFSALLDSELDKEHYMKVVQAASDEISSDFELASLLIELIDKHSIDADVEKAIRDATDSIGSSFERKRVINLLNKKAG
ncbi:M56 family metallopeptidase [Aliikangiella coralliicola]|nr:M56 family metallopeptidase [Aliikangiella coralliicola]